CLIAPLEMLRELLGRFARAKDPRHRERHDVLADKEDPFFALIVLHRVRRPITVLLIEPCRPQVRRFTHMGIRRDDTIGCHTTLLWPAIGSCSSPALSLSSLCLPSRFARRMPQKAFSRQQSVVSCGWGKGEREKRRNSWRMSKICALRAVRPSTSLTLRSGRSCTSGLRINCQHRNHVAYLRFAPLEG